MNNFVLEIIVAFQAYVAAIALKGSKGICNFEPIGAKVAFKVLDIG